MFIIDINYTASLDVIDQHLAQHRSWLDTKYQEGLLLCSGPKNPRTGGVIIALLKNRQAMENLVREDPYHINNLATYSITEFTPVKYHLSIKDII